MDEMKVSEGGEGSGTVLYLRKCSMDGRMSAIMENLNQKGSV